MSMSMSMWCAANHMLFNHVKTISMLITTRQSYQLSDLSPRQSLDGQSVEQVTLKKVDVDEKQVGCIIMQNTFKRHISSLSAATFHHQRHQKHILQRPYKTSHRLCFHSLGWLWGGTLKN